MEPATTEMNRNSLSFDPAWINSLPILDELQAGSLRHMLNLSARLPDDWSGMQGRSTLQEDFSTLRFQLAYMSYALALTHVHRMPAAPALFEGAFDSLIQKILSPDVWTYWHYVSTGNGPLNRSLGELPANWNPVEKDNIMYSAYVQSMALLFHYLFRNAKYAAPGALTFSLHSLFWGLGGKHFPYDERSLNDHIYWSMVERGYLGIACEPNCVFQICNQVPILGFRFHDLVYGGALAKDATEGYLKAWSEFGVLGPEGHYNAVVMERERQVVPWLGAWGDLWLAALMNAWNPDFVKKNYPAQIESCVVKGPGQTLYVSSHAIPSYRGPELTSALDFGWAAVSASEVGDRQTLTQLLAYADRFMRPTWKDRGYFYPRHDQKLDADGNFSSMDPHTGNVLLGYARLNVPDGLRKLYDGPWDDEHFAEPAVAAMSMGLDLRRAWFDAARNALVLTIDQNGARSGYLEISNALNRGQWQLVRDGAAFPAHTKDDRLVIELEISGETTLVLSWR